MVQESFLSLKMALVLWTVLAGASAITLTPFSLWRLGVLGIYAVVVTAMLRSLVL